MQAESTQFNQAFIERRMREHRAWQEMVTTQLCKDALDDLGIERPSDQRTLEFRKPAARRTYALGA